jgi:hypothetical protein
MMPTDDGERGAIEITAPTLAQAQRLVAQMNGFETEVVPGGSYTVRVTPEGETRERLVSLFDAIGSWLTSSGLTSSKISFGDNAIVVLPASETEPNDPAQFLLERTRQLEHALTSRIQIEQAKGLLAERLGLSLDAAFELLRKTARNSGRKIHDVAADVLTGKLDLKDA